MSIRVVCSCGKTLKAEDAFAGKTAPCPSCGNLVRIPIHNGTGSELQEVATNAGRTESLQAKSHSQATPAVQNSGPAGSSGIDRVRGLIEQLKDSNSAVGSKAAWALGGIGAAAVPWLIDALKSENINVRIGSVVALEIIGPPAVTELMVALMDENQLARLAAAEALGGIGPAAQAAIPVLVHALSDVVPEVRSKAAATLGKIGPSAAPAVPILIQTLADSDESVRMNAVQALGKIGPAAGSSINALVRLLRDTHDDVRECAAEAIASIGPQTIQANVLDHRADDDLDQIEDEEVNHAPDTKARYSPTPDGALREFVGHESKVISLVFSPDGRHCLSGSLEAMLWESGTGRELHRFDGVASAVAFSPRGDQIAIGDGDGFVQVWRLRDFRVLRRFSEFRNPVYGIVYLPDGRLVAACSSDGTARIWDLVAGRQIQCFEHVDDWELIDSMRETDGPNLSRHLYLLQHPEMRESVFGLAISPDCSQVVTGSTYGRLSLWDIKSGQEVCRLKMAEDCYDDIKAVAFAPNGRDVLFCGSEDWTIHLWDLETKCRKRTFEGHEGEINSLVMSQDGSRALSGSSDGTMRLWEIATGKELRRFEITSIEEGVTCVAMSPDARLALSGDDGGIVRLWRLVE